VLLPFVFAGGCTVWAQAHGPAFGVAIEVDDEWNFSPRLQVTYEFDRYDGIALGFGGGGGVAVSILEPRFELFGELRGYFFPVPTVAFGPVIAYDPRLGWSGGFRGGGSLQPAVFFWPPEYCTLGWYEQTRDYCPPTEYTAEDMVYPVWLPHVGYRITMLWSFERTREALYHQLFFAATIADHLLWADAPGPVLAYGER
jgi:hypothetical protein